MPNQDVIFGLHAIHSLLKANSDCIIQLSMDKKRHDQRIQEIVQAAQASGLAVNFIDRDELDKLSRGGNHQGVVAACKLPQPKDETFLDELLERQPQPLLLVLDGVQDPQNLGACLRTADATGVSAVIIPKDRSVALTSTVIKVASGAAYTVPVVSVTNLSRTIRQLQAAGVWFVGTDADADQTLYDVALTGSIAVVLGAEGSGLRRLTKELCDYLVKLPMLGSVESLNVSVATGVCLYEVLRQRAVPIGR